MAKYNDVTAEQTEACINRMGGRDNFLQLINPSIKVSTRDRFVVEDNFRKGKAGIYYLSDNFQKLFGGKVETNVPAATLSSYKIIQNSVDGPIKTELGEDH